LRGFRSPVDAELCLLGGPLTFGVVGAVPGVAFFGGRPRLLGGVACSSTSSGW